MAVNPNPHVFHALQAGRKLVDSPPYSVAGALNKLVALYYDHSLVSLNKLMWRMAMSFSIQRSQTPCSQRYSELDRLICQQFSSLLLALQIKGKIKLSLDHDAMAHVILNNLNMMFVEFVKSDSMTIQELKVAVRHQTNPLSKLIGST